MALLAYFDRLKAQGGDANAQQDLVDAKKYGQMGLDALPKFTKPDGTSDADFQKMKDQMTGIFNAAIGIADLTAKDYDVREKLYAPPPIAALTHRRISVWFTLWPWLMRDPRRRIRSFRPIR